MSILPGACAKSKLYIVTLLIGLVSCDSSPQYGHLIGEWEVIQIDASGERLELSEVLDNRSIQFTNRGEFKLGEPTLPDGKWKIFGKRLRMTQPQIVDLNGRIISPEINQEWNLRISAEWMIWQGTARNQTQHLKIQLRKVHRNLTENSR